MDEKIKTVLHNYDEVARLVLDQKVDEMSDSMENLPTDAQDFSYEAYIQRIVMVETKKQCQIMETEPNELLDGQSMNEYFAGKSFEELAEIMEYCSINLDNGTPKCVIDAVAALPDKAMICSYCSSTIKEAAWTEEELKDEDLVFEIEFAKVKTCFEVLKAVDDDSLIEEVIARFMSYPQTRDFVAESIAEYIEAFPKTSTPLMISLLAQHKDDGMQGPCEDLVIMLSHIGKATPSEEIYMALKDAFRSMTNKIYAVICLSDLGDGRAVPLLKGYVNRNQKTIDRELFYEIMTAIRDLGGDISDIQDPFGDFEKKLDKGSKN